MYQGLVSEGILQPPRRYWTRTGLREGLIADSPAAWDRAGGCEPHTLGTRHGACLRGGLKPGDLAAPASPKSHRDWGGTSQLRRQPAAREVSGRRPRRPGAGPPHRTARQAGGCSSPWQLPRPGLPGFPRSVNCVLQIKIATSER